MPYTDDYSRIQGKILGIIKKVDEKASLQLSNEFIVIREFEFVSKDTRHSHRFTQNHYVNWPDGGIPNLQVFQEFMNLIQQSPVKTQLVHCSAGLGRTGILILSAMCRDLIDYQLSIKAEVQIDVIAFLKAIRNERPNLVQSQRQLDFVCNYLRVYLAEKNRF